MIGQMTSKKRSLDVAVDYPSVKDANGSTVLSAGTRTWEGSQYTESEGHDASQDGKYREGGEFFTTLTRAVIPTVNVKTVNEFGRNKWIYSGPVYVPGVPTNLITGELGLPRPDNGALDKAGAEAISRCAPTNPAANVSVGLGEIFKEGFPKLPGISTWKQRTELAKAAGSEFLNTAFGWLPMIEEMKSVTDAVKNHELILKQYIRDEGRPVRRDYVFPYELSKDEEDLGYSSAAVAGGRAGGFQSPNGPGRYTRFRETRTRRWFVGSFTYGGPSKVDSFAKHLGYGSDADKLLGTSLTPDVLWNLAPWSWAADWFSNAGEVINNLTQFEINGLVMRYGYIMEEKYFRETYSLSHAGLKAENGKTVDVAMPDAQWESITKVRRAANPYGFGIGWEGLSPFQMAVTAALGITRLR